MRRTLTNTMLLGCTLLVAACGDQPTAPAGPQRAAPTPPAANVYVNAYTNGLDATEADLTVTPSGGWFAMGSNVVYFPANSICDPATSTYGVGHWDEPCTAATTPIHIHAKLNKDAQWIDFTPALRFVPAADSRKWVYLYVFSPKLWDKTAPSGSANYNMLWIPSVGATGVDESLDDPSLQTHTDNRHGLVYRRVKHFSGYQVIVGLVDDAEAAVSY